MSLGTEAGTEPLWPQRGQADGHPAAFADTLCPAPAERRPTVSGALSIHACCPHCPESLLCPRGLRRPRPGLRQNQGPLRASVLPRAPCRLQVCGGGHPARPSPAGSRPPGALPPREPAFAWPQWEPLVLWNGHGRTGRGGRGDSGGEEEGPLDGRGPPGL